jgi:hypothetical protein
VSHQAGETNVEKERVGSNGYPEYHKAGTTSGTENRHGLLQRMVPSASMGMDGADDYLFEANPRLNSDIERSRKEAHYNAVHYSPEMIVESTRLALLVGDASEQPRFEEPASAPDSYLLFGEYFKAMHPDLCGDHHAKKMFPGNYPELAVPPSASAPSAPFASTLAPLFTGQLLGNASNQSEEDKVRIIMREYSIGDYNEALAQISRCKRSALPNARYECNSECQTHQERTKQAKIAKEKDQAKKDRKLASKSRRPWGGHVKSCPQGRALDLQKRWKALQDTTVRTSNESELPHAHLRNFFDAGGPRPGPAKCDSNSRKRTASNSPTNSPTNSP